MSVGGRKGKGKGCCCAAGPRAWLGLAHHEEKGRGKGRGGMLLLGCSSAHVGGGEVGRDCGLGREVVRDGCGPGADSGPRGRRRRGEKRRGGLHLWAKEREREEFEPMGLFHTRDCFFYFPRK
jgi:hypothetical protein